MLDPEDRCTSTNGTLRCVLRPHGIGDHIGLEHEGTPGAVPQWWDRDGVALPPAVPAPELPAPPPTLVPFNYSGDACEKCGQFALVRTGKCVRCASCGDDTGGCS